MQENKIRLNSFLCIPKWVDKHGTAVGACWRTTKSGWTINDQPYTKVLLCICSSDMWLGSSNWHLKQVLTALDDNKSSIIKMTLDSGLTVNYSLT